MPRRHGLGRIADLPDHRDHVLNVTAPTTLPTYVDLRPSMPPIGDQGQLGSCTAWASTAAYRYELVRQKLPDFEPSELFQYYVTRSLEGTTRSDAGATIRDAIKALGKFGAVPASQWPYDISKFAKAPTAAVKKAALRNVALEYQSVPQDLTSIRTALAGGLPVVIGISVYASFESDAVAKTGLVPMPAKSEQLLGGHAVVICGYDDASSQFIVRNSWGASWGKSGYFYLPYTYVMNPQLASDFWVIRQVEELAKAA